MLNYVEKVFPLFIKICNAIYTCGCAAHFLKLTKFVIDADEELHTQ